MCEPRRGTLKIGRLDAEAPEVTLGDDSPVHTRLIGVRAQGLVGFEVLVALDEKPERTAELVHADETEFRRAHSQVAEPKGDIVET